MRDLTIEETGYVSGAGGDNCHPNPEPCHKEEHHEEHKENCHSYCD